MVEAPVVFHRVFNAVDLIVEVEGIVAVSWNLRIRREGSQELLQPFHSGFGIEQSRLIHIVPERIDSGIGQNMVVHSKPVSGFVIQKIREYRITGPDRADKIGFLIFHLAEVAFFNAFFIDRIASFYFDSGIDNGNEMNLLVLHLLDKVLKIRFEFVPVQGEVLKILHVVNIHVDHVYRDVNRFQIF